MKIFILLLSVLVTVASAFYSSTDSSEAYSAEFEDYYSHMPYSFGYEVNDDYHGNYHARQENSDGKVVTGSYTVALPDGRTQIVTYRADENGYFADVKYEGEARYPEYITPALYWAIPEYEDTDATVIEYPGYFSEESEEGSGFW